MSKPTLIDSTKNSLFSATSIFDDTLFLKNLICAEITVITDLGFDRSTKQQMLLKKKWTETDLAEFFAKLEKVSPLDPDRQFAKGKMWLKGKKWLEYSSDNGYWTYHNAPSIPEYLK